MCCQQRQRTYYQSGRPGTQSTFRQNFAQACPMLGRYRRSRQLTPRMLALFSWVSNVECRIAGKAIARPSRPCSRDRVVNSIIMSERGLGRWRERRLATGVGVGRGGYAARNVAVLNPQNLESRRSTTCYRGSPCRYGRDEILSWFLGCIQMQWRRFLWAPTAYRSVSERSCKAAKAIEQQSGQRDCTMAAPEGVAHGIGAVWKPWKSPHCRSSPPSTTAHLGQAFLTVMESRTG